MPSDVKDAGPLAAPGAARRLAPFVVANLVAFATLFIPPAPPRPGEAALGFGLMLVIMAGALLIPWRRLPLWTQAIPPIAYFLVVGLVRHAAGGGASGFALMALFPVFWFALYGTPRQLYGCLVVLGATFLVPLLTIGPPDYTAADLRRGTMGVLFGAIVGITVQRLTLSRAELLEQLSQLARIDDLTGLPNRRAWDEQSERERARAQRSGAPLNIAMLDLDHFKTFNDLHGHLAGDRFLNAAAAAWRKQLRETDTLARYGGEEFALALPGCSLPVALEVLERMRVATPNGQACSIGIAAWDGAESAAELLDRADRALYMAKDSGRDQITVARSAPLAAVASAL